MEFKVGDKVRWKNRLDTTSWLITAIGSIYTESGNSFSKIMQFEGNHSIWYRQDEFELVKPQLTLQYYPSGKDIYNFKPGDTYKISGVSIAGYVTLEKV